MFTLNNQQIHKALKYVNYKGKFQEWNFDELNSVIYHIHNFFLVKEATKIFDLQYNAEYIIGT